MDAVQRLALRLERAAVRMVAVGEDHASVIKPLRVALALMEAPRAGVFQAVHQAMIAARGLPASQTPVVAGTYVRLLVVDSVDNQSRNQVN